MRWFSTKWRGRGEVTPQLVAPRFLINSELKLNVAIFGGIHIHLQFNSPKAATLLATASMAWILAVAAAAATAAAVGRAFEPVDGPSKAFGGVIARPTLKSVTI